MSADLVFCGNSVVVAPDGTVLARGSDTEPGILFAEMDFKGPAMQEAISQNPYLSDRRPELYDLPK